MIAIVAVYGIAWMAETMFGAHMSEIQGVLGEMVKEYPWAYAIVLLLVSKFVNSQAAALAAIVPVALAIGVDPAYIVASALGMLWLLYSADLPKRSGGDSV